MFSLVPELEHLREDGVLDADSAGRLIALERREVVSVYGELRFLAWGGVMLIATGVGILVKKNLDRIGPLAIAMAIGAAAVACYAYSFWRMRPARADAAADQSQSAVRGPRSAVGPVDDFILLLAALLASADLGFIEHQWHVLGANWQRHFLVLALLHAVTAYLFNSRLVLSLSLSALAAFLGIERSFGAISHTPIDLALRAEACAAVIFAWRAIDATIRGRALPRLGPEADAEETANPFAPVFDHFATNLAFWGALALAVDESFFIVGVVLAFAFAFVAARVGLQRREEMFVIYAWIYGLIALNILLFRVVHEPLLTSFLGMASFAGAIVGLVVIHIQMRKART